MKKLLWIFAGALLFSNLFVSTGCGDDTTTDNDLAPVAVLTAGPTPDVAVSETETEVTVSVEATKGTKALKTVTVYQGSTKVDLDHFKVDGVLASANPILITSPTDVMTWDITLIVHEDNPGTAEYSVVVEDEGGKSDEVTFSVTVQTKLEADLDDATLLLYNQAGPAGRGGIDLEDGSSTGTKLGSSGDDSYLRAELRDMGIDSLAGSGDNWRRRIGGINNTEVRYVGNVISNPDILDFDGVASKEAIEDIFGDAEALKAASTYTTGGIDAWGNFQVSEVVQEGDVFAVYKSSSSTYYLVKVKTITETTTLANNEDNYRVEIKY